MAELIQIDGSYGEGGGQVIRTALALSAITGHPIELINIRGKRSKPGLQAQHLMSVKAAAEICKAEVHGQSLGSQSIYFAPSKPVEAGEYRFDIGTAGSTSLVLQTIFMPLVLADGPSKVTVSGGTHNPMAPCSDYLAKVFLPAMARMGVVTTFNTPHLGFYPRGGGVIECGITANEPLAGILLEERGKPKSKSATVSTALLGDEVGDRGAKRMKQLLPHDMPVQIHRGTSAGPGAAAFASYEFEGALAGFTGLGERGKRMETVAEEAAKPAVEWLAMDATVDEHLADQLVLPAIFAQGPSRWNVPVVTEHLRTIVWLVHHFVEREIHIDEVTGWVSVA